MGRTILKAIITLIYVFGFNTSLKSQQETPYIINGIGQERIFIHYNAPLFFVGEYLYYRVYCLNSNTNNLSDISKIAYVRLIGEDGNTIFSQKVTLENGLGQGDFFIPVSVPSGNYKLIGFTRWMRNWEQEQFYQGDITIINPYSNDQKPFLGEDDMDSIPTKKNDAQDGFTKNGKAINFKNGNVTLSVPKKVYGKREKVALSLSASNERMALGNYSLSVRKIDDFSTAKSETAREFIQKAERVSSKPPTGDRGVLPELRGTLVRGQLKSVDTTRSLKGIPIALSIPGKEYLLQIAKTSETGTFYFNLNDPKDKGYAFLQVLGNKNKTFQIEIKEDSTTLDHKRLNFGSFKLDKSLDSIILERSIHNQIENAFFKAKPDTLASIQGTPAFYGTMGNTYKLDDFTRFPTLRETVLEIIDNVWIEEKDNSDFCFKIRSPYESEMDDDFNSLLIVDGLLVQNQKEFLEYDSRRIESIHVVRGVYRNGAQFFHGILDVKTFDSDYLTKIDLSIYNRIQFLNVLSKKKYFRQFYSEETQDEKEQIPDLRYQLLWVPNVKMGTREKYIDFFTSDVSGDFEVSLEGFSANGTPVSTKKVFSVN